LSIVATNFEWRAHTPAATSRWIIEYGLPKSAGLLEEAAR
jgi:hypothetical protein